MNYWLVKQEPTGPKGYPFSQFQKEKKTDWTGVRNFQARNNLRAMKKGDFVFYYHSNEGKEVVGTATVTKEAFPDPTAQDGDWSCVELKAGKAFPQPVGLPTIKEHATLKDMVLAKNSRLSVMPVTAKEKTALLKLGGLNG
ncbi:MAG: EVE domain-containing protein [Verrucomicrobiota bacterium]